MRRDQVPAKRQRVLAISSGGGHWVQLMRLAPAFDDAEVVYACADASVASQVAGSEFHSYPDANLDRPTTVLLAFFRIAWILLRTRPDAIVSTGAAGGGIAIAIGRLFGVRGLFVDSIANTKDLSVSARLSLRLAHRVFTQWPAVAATSTARFHGSVL